MKKRTQKHTERRCCSTRAVHVQRVHSVQHCTNSTQKCLLLRPTPALARGRHRRRPPAPPRHYAGTGTLLVTNESGALLGAVSHWPGFGIPIHIQRRLYGIDHMQLELVILLVILRVLPAKVLYFSYMIAMSRSLEVFTCTRDVKANRWTLDAEPSLTCWDGTTQSLLVPYAALTLVLYGLGTVVLFIFKKHGPAIKRDQRLWITGAGSSLESNPDFGIRRRFARLYQAFSPR